MKTNEETAMYGFSVLREALPTVVLKETHRICAQDWKQLVDGGGMWFGGGSILGHLNYRPAKTLPLLAAVLSNDLLGQCVRSVLGNEASLLAIGGNVNMPNSRFQPIHIDGKYDSRFLAMGIPLGDVSESNGSIEVFPGSHLGPTTLRAFRAQYQPEAARRINTRSGDVILRHPNVWHRGTANLSRDPRFMLYFLFGPPREPAHGLATLPGSEFTSAPVVSLLPDQTGEFFPNYFSRTPSGYIKELSCRYLPKFYDAIRLIANR